MSRHSELDQLTQAVAKERAAAREAELEASRAEQAREEAREALIQAHVADSPQAIKKAETAASRADKGAADAALHAEVAGRKVGLAERASKEFEQAHARELLDELEADDRLALEEFVAALTQLT
jgi:hypothetical protein